MNSYDSTAVLQWMCVRGEENLQTSLIRQTDGIYAQDFHSTIHRVTR
jgi:hypothetical protein